MSHESAQPPPEPGAGQPGWGPPPPGWGPPASGQQPPAGAPTHPYGYPQFPQLPRPAKPGVVELRPLSVSDLLDGTFAVLRRAPLPTLLNAGVIYLAMGLLGAVLLVALGLEETLAAALSLAEDPEAIAEFSTEAFPYPWFVYAGLGALAFIAYLVAYALVAAPATVATMRGTLGRPTTWRQSLALSRPSIARLVGLELLLGVAALLPVAALMVAGTWLLSTVGFDLLVPLLLAGALLALATIWVGVRLTLAPVLVVSQSLSIGSAIARSWRLSRGSWWRIFGIVLVVSLVIGVLGGVISTIMAVAEVFPGSAAGIWVVTALSMLVNALVGAVSAVLLQVLVTLLHVDLRIRHERLDIQLLGELADPAAHPIPGHAVGPAQSR